MTHRGETFTKKMIEKPIKSFGSYGSGSYIASIQVKGRNGWLSRSELDQLIESLEQYLQTSLDDAIWEKTKLTTREKRNIDLVHKVDNAYAVQITKNDRSLYFMSKTKSGVSSWKCLLRTSKNFIMLRPKMSNTLYKAHNMWVVHRVVWSQGLSLMTQRRVPTQKQTFSSGSQ